MRLPERFPDGRILNACLVIAVAVATALATFGSRPTSQIAPAGTAPATLAPVLAPADPAPTAASVDAPVSASDEQGPAVVAPEFVQAPSLPQNAELAVARAPAAGPLLPDYRVVTFYGHPHDANMGIVGEHEMVDLANLLRAEAANYYAADPSRPVIPAFELIATVAQRTPGEDGTFILDTDRETLQTYIDYADQQGMLVILDLQVGRGTVENEIEKVRDLLARPNVHLAIDPEFAIKEGETPGDAIGSVPYESIVYAQHALADISATNSIPPKLLIVHQFREDMIAGKNHLAPYPGVQLVIDADGYGAPELKTAVYNFLVRNEPVEYAGVKIFYRQDMPLMTAQEILALVPAPDVIVYQ